MHKRTAIVLSHERPSLVAAISGTPHSEQHSIGREDADKVVLLKLALYAGYTHRKQTHGLVGSGNCLGSICIECNTPLGKSLAVGYPLLDA